MKTKFLALLFALISFNSLFSQSSIYVYTDKNLLPGDELKAQVSGYNTVSDKISFEIYRIKDPIKFATSQFDFYNFIDNSFNELQIHFELINSTQKRIKSYKNWFVETFEIGKFWEKGTYLVKAVLEDKSSFAFFTISEIGLISKRSIDDILIYASNRKSSEPISNLDMKLISIDKKIFSLKTNKEGVAIKSIGDRAENRRFYVLIIDNDTTILHQEQIYSPSDEYDRYLVYTYTNQPVYRPKQKASFKSLIRERKQDELSIPKKLEVRVKVLMPDNSILLDTNCTTNSYGTISASVEIPEEAPVGQYTILIEINGLNYTESFFVEEYKKPEYKVTVKSEKDNYSPSEEIEIKVLADYFFGKPVHKGNVKLLLYRKPLVRHWWEFEPFSEFYRGCFIDIIPYYTPELLLEKEGELVDGEFKFKYKVDQNIERNYEYQVVAYVKDETNREVMGSYKFLVTKYRINLTTNPDRYFYAPNSKIILKVVTNDFSFKPLKKKFSIIIQRVHYINFSEYYEDVDTLRGETQADGIGFVEYQTSIGGKYSYIVVVDDEGKKINARGNFIVTDKEIKVSGFREGIQVIPAKDIFNEADELEFLVISLFKDVNVFVTLEQSKVYEHRVIKLNGNSAIIKFKTKLPAVAHISAGFYFENQYLSYLKRFGILKSKQKLNIAITSDKNVYKPGEKGNFKIKVTDNQGKPVRNAELSSSIIDESIYSIKPEQSKNIFDVITQASIYKILTTSTELPYFFINREIQFQKLTEFKELKKSGSATLSGKVLNANTGDPIANAEIKLVRGNSQISAVTNAKGRFVIRNIPEGRYDFVVDAPLYQKKIIPSLDIKEGARVRLSTIRLMPVEVQVSPIHVDNLIIKGGFVFSREATNGIRAEGVLSKAETPVDQFIEPTVRKDFKDAIYWSSNLITDEEGEVKIEVKYPDNLTSWRNTIKAITVDNRAGESFANVVVRKEILIRVETPRYVHEKDEVILPVIVHNYSEKEQRVKINIDVRNGIVLLDKDLRMKMQERILNPDEYVIKPNEVIKTNWVVRVSEKVDSLVITAKALVAKSGDTGQESDAIEIKIPVEAIGYPEFIVNNFSITKNTEKISSQIYLNGEKRNVKVMLKLSPTLLGNILSSIDELVAFPYGCVEQTMSRFLPAIIVANLIKELKLDIKQKTLDELPKVISEGLKRLKDFQNIDGGWGWWKNDQTNTFMTAYVMYGLSLTKKAGYNVDDEMMKKGMNVLRKLLNQKMDNGSFAAYILYSFSELLQYSETVNNDRELLKKKFDELKRVDNDPFVISKLLEIAIQNGFNDEVKKLKNKLLKLAVVDGNIVYWGKKDFYYGHFVNDPIEITSAAIRSLILSGEKSSLIENAIRWLVNQKRGAFWFSTKQTASVIFSIVEFIKSSDELNADFIVKINLNGREIKSFKFDRSNLKRGEINFELSSGEFRQGLNQIEIEKSGRGKLYFSLIEKYFKSIYEKEDQPFDVERKFYVVRFEKEGEKLVKKISELKDEIKVGDRILVELKVKARKDFEYFMLEDPITPGFERLNELNEQEYLHRWFYHFKEERDKKTAFFVTNLNKGEYTFSYITYAQIPGNYTVPPAVASLMYYPDIRGIGKEKVIRITE